MEQYRLEIKLVDGWGDYSHENPEGPPTYLRDRSEVPEPGEVEEVQEIVKNITLVPVKAWWKLW